MRKSVWFAFVKANLFANCIKNMVADSTTKTAHAQILNCSCIYSVEIFTHKRFDRFFCHFSCHDLAQILHKFIRA